MLKQEKIIHKHIYKICYIQLKHIMGPHQGQIWSQILFTKS